MLCSGKSLDFSILLLGLLVTYNRLSTLNAWRKLSDGPASLLPYFVGEATLASIMWSRWCSVLSVCNLSARCAVGASVAVPQRHKLSIRCTSPAQYRSLGVAIPVVKHCNVFSQVLPHTDGGAAPEPWGCS